MVTILKRSGFYSFWLPRVGRVNCFGEILSDQRGQPEALFVEGRVCKMLYVRISKKDLAGKVNKLDWRRFSHLNVGSYKLQPIN